MNAIISPVGFTPVPIAQGFLDALLAIDLRGDLRTVWTMLVEAGPRGVTSDDLRDRIYDGRSVPASWAHMRSRHFGDLQRRASGQGLAIVVDRSQIPARWYLSAPPEPYPEPPPAAAAPVVRPPSLPRSIGRASTIVPIVFEGIAAAVAGLQANSCRWLLDQPSACGSLFCTEVIRQGSRSYCPEHHRRASDGPWSSRNAA